MRQELREAGKHVPRSNKDTEEAYSKMTCGEVLAIPPIKSKEECSTETVVKLVSSNIYTYVGAGDTPPHMINFMGMQNFIRGQATEVTNQTVLDKIKTNPCFKKGKVNMDELFEKDKIEKNKAEEQNKKNQILELEMKRKNG